MVSVGAAKGCFQRLSVELCHFYSQLTKLLSNGLVAIGFIPVFLAFCHEKNGEKLMVLAQTSH